MGEIENAISRAVAAANSGPEEYREATYVEVLRHLLSKVAPPDEPLSGPGLEQGLPEAGPARTVTLPEPDLVADSDDHEMQTVWAVMALAEEGREAINETIRQKIELALAVTPQNRQNTNRTLRRLVPRYLARRKKNEGEGYAYVPTARAREIFQNLEEDAND